MTFRVFSISNEQDRAEWLALLANLPSQDIHFDPAYIHEYAKEEGVESFCWVLERSGALVMQPIVVRGNEVGNVYCYGDILKNGPAAFWPEMQSLFETESHRWMRSNNIERIRYRFHPWTIPNGFVREKIVVFIDLTQDRVEDDFRKGHKSSIALALKSGVTVEESDSIDLFHAMYEAMLSRNGSERRISVCLLEELGASYPDGFRILIAKVNGEPEAGCILLGAHSTMYYHYAASFGKYRDIGVGNLLVLEAARKAKEMGFKRLHLGGGLTNDPMDGLLRFKAGFSKQRAWTYVYELKIKSRTFAEIRASGFDIKIPNFEIPTSGLAIVIPGDKE